MKHAQIKNRNWSVEVLNAGQPLPAEVSCFFEAHASANVELRQDWFELLAHCVPHLAEQARYLVLRDDQGCAAVWPVQVGDEPGALSNYFTALYEPVHRPDLAPADLAPLVGALRRESQKAGVYRFAPMDPEKPSFVALESALKSAGMLTSRYYRFGNWYLPTRGLNWQQFIDARSSKLRNTIKRTGRKFQAEGGRLELIRGGSDIDRAIDAYSHVYAASWKEREPFHEFVSSLVRLGAERGWLRMGIAWLGDTPIAAQIWIVAYGRAEIFKLAYDMDYRRYSPGTLLTAMLLESCFVGEHVTEVDYLIGDDPYKTDWMTHRRERWGLIAHDPRTLRGALGALRQALTEGVKGLRRKLGLAESAGDSHGHKNDADGRHGRPVHREDGEG